MLVTKARQRARGGGDNLSVAMARIDPLRAERAPAASSLPPLPTIRAT
jgi:hypothetical protein